MTNPEKSSSLTTRPRRLKPAIRILKHDHNINAAGAIFVALCRSARFVVPLQFYSGRPVEILSI
jgi:hypothetical protein